MSTVPHDVPHDMPCDEDSDNDESVGTSCLESTKFIFKTAPQLGYHMSISFTKQIWSNVMSLHLGFELYRILLLSAILEQKLYKLQLNNKRNDRILQFLLSSTEEQDTQQRYMEVMADLCFLFVNCEQVELYPQWVLPCFAPGREWQLPKELSCHSVMTLDQKCKLIINLYQQISSHSSRTFHLNTTYLRQKGQLEHKYQTVCFLVFHYWMKFKANVKLRDAVYRHLKLDEAGREQQTERAKPKNIHDPSVKYHFTS